MMNPLPTQVILTLDGESDDFTVQAQLVTITDDGETISTSYDLGHISRDGTHEEWALTFGEDCQIAGEEIGGGGPFESIGMSLDNLFDYEELFEDSDESEEEEDDDESEEEEDDDESEEEEDEEDEEDEDWEEPEHIDGRRWTLISRTDDSITYGMNLGTGCLVRVEVEGCGDDGFGVSTCFIPSTTVEKIVNGQ